MKSIFHSPWIRRVLVIMGLQIVFMGLGGLLPVLSGRIVSASSGEIFGDQTAIAYTEGQTHTVYLPMTFSYYRFGDPLPFGIQNYGNLSNASSTLSQRLYGLNAAWVRHPISWANIEPVNTTPDKYNWASYDAQILNVSKNNLRMVATVCGNPSWTKSNNPDGYILPIYWLDYLEFIEALVERYDGDGYNDASGSPVVKYWEFYNEPDAISRWGYRGDDYADFMSSVYPVVKSANPSSVVLMGGIAYDWFKEESDDGPFVRAFLDDFLSAGGGNFIDMFNFHYYPRVRWAEYGYDVLGKLNYLKSKMASYGVKKPVAITETGLNSDQTGGSSEEKQGDYVVKVFNRALAGDVKIMIWFLLYDAPPTFYYGLTYSDLSPKPSYLVYQTMTTEMENAFYQRTLTASELGISQKEGLAYRAEGYVYARGRDTMYVVWTNDSSTVQIKIRAKSVTKIDKYGNSTVINAAGDGLVSITYTASPVYLVLNP